MNHLINQQCLLYLIRAATALSNGNDLQAEYHVNRSRQLADSSMIPSFKPRHHARCYYWQCRIAWFRNDLLAACVSLTKARDIFIELPEPSPELRHIDEYFLALRRGIPYADRGAAVSLQTQTQAGPSSSSFRRNGQGRKGQIGTMENNHLKRKRGQPRPRPKQKLEGPLRYKVIPYAMRPAQRRNERRRLSDAARPRRERTATSTVSKGGMARPVEQTYTFPEKSFTFTKHFTGLSPRTRPTNIFPKQPYERIYSQEVWEKIQARTANMPVTMKLLMLEREKMLEQLDGALV